MRKPPTICTAHYCYWPACGRLCGCTKPIQEIRIEILKQRYRHKGKGAK